MAKIVTSTGVQDFIASGKPTEVIEGDQTQAIRAKKLALNTKLAATDSPVIEANTQPAAPPEEKTDAAKSPEAVKEAPREPSDADLDEEEKKFAKDIQKKIFKQIAKRKEAQSEAATAREEAAEAERFAEQQFNERQLWQKRAEEAEKKITVEVPRETPKEEAKPPNPEDKKYYDADNKFKVWEYSADLADHAAKKALADDKKAQEAEREKQRQDAVEKARKAAAEAFAKRLEKAKEKHSDFMQVIESTPVVLQNECLTYIAGSVNGSELAYFLALPKNQERAEKIRALEPMEGVAALRDLEHELGLTKLAAPPATAAAPKEAEPVRSAPAPITPISTSGNGSVNLDPAKMDFKQLRAFRRAEAREKGRR